jgi:nitroimidazol reductase NimA-like FMN-containing flavoprotein (pyridoxamine 5'-phosphate oxidase superfamily)
METDHLGITILPVEECLDLLGGETVGRLAVSVRDRPDIFPVNYVVDRDGIVFRTATGTKLAASVLGRGVAFEVDGVDEHDGAAWSVVVKGRAVEVTGVFELLDALQLPLFPWHDAPKHRFVRIEPIEITGRRFHVVDRSAWSDPVRTGP